MDFGSVRFRGYLGETSYDSIKIEVSASFPGGGGRRKRS